MNLHGDGARILHGIVCNIYALCYIRYYSIIIYISQLNTIDWSSFSLTSVDNTIRMHVALTFHYPLLQT